MGLILDFVGPPPPGGGLVAHAPDDRLAARMHVDVLDSHRLSIPPLQLRQRLNLGREGSKHLRGDVPGAFELRNLLSATRPGQKIHGQHMRDRHLTRQHRLDLIGRTNPAHNSEKRIHPALIDRSCGCSGSVDKAVQLSDRERRTAGPEDIFEPIDPSRTVGMRWAELRPALRLDAHCKGRISRGGPLSGSFDRCALR
jgi:hypothetical protein